MVKNFWISFTQLFGIFIFNYAITIDKNSVDRLKDLLKGNSVISNRLKDQVRSLIRFNDYAFCSKKVNADPEYESQYTSIRSLLSKYDDGLSIYVETFNSNDHSEYTQYLILTTLPLILASGICLIFFHFIIDDITFRENKK